jgi:hypothetical protein
MMRELDFNLDEWGKNLKKAYSLLGRIDPHIFIESPSEEIKPLMIVLGRNPLETLEFLTAEMFKALGNRYAEEIATILPHSIYIALPIMNTSMNTTGIHIQKLDLKNEVSECRTYAYDDNHTSCKEVEIPDLKDLIHILLVSLLRGIRNNPKVGYQN